MPTRLAAGALLLLVMALGAFWPQYLSRPPARVDAYTHAHALLGAAWMLLLVAQPLLLRAGARAGHRALGRASWALAPAFLVSGLLLAHFRFRTMDEPTFLREAFTLYLPLSALLLFAVAWALGLAQRRHAPVHARFMAATALLLIDPVLGRLLFFFGPPLPHPLWIGVITFGLEIALLLVLLRTLPAAAPGRALFRGYVALTAVVLGGWFVWPSTAAWMALARGFRALPLT